MARKESYRFKDFLIDGGIIIGGLLLVFLPQMMPDPMSPTAVAHEFLNAIEENDFDEAKEYATEGTQRELELMESLLDSQDHLEEPDYVNVTDEDVYGNRATVFYRLGSSYDELSLSMVKEKGDWKVETTKKDLTSRTGSISMEDQLNNALEELDQADSKYEEAVEEPSWGEYETEVASEKTVETAIILGDKINLRDQPSTKNTRILTQLNRGDKVTILDSDYDNSDFSLVRKTAAFIPFKGLNNDKLNYNNEVFLNKGKAIRVVEKYREIGGFYVVEVETSAGTFRRGIISGNLLDMQSGSLWYYIETASGQTGWVIEKYIGEIRNESKKQLSGHLNRNQARVLKAPGFHAASMKSVYTWDKLTILGESTINEEVAFLTRKSAFIPVKKGEPEEIDYSGQVDLPAGTMVEPQRKFEDVLLEGEVAWLVNRKFAVYSSQTGIIAESNLEFKSNTSWYKVSTDSGVEGYLPKDYVKLEVN